MPTVRSRSSFRRSARLSSPRKWVRENGTWRCLPAEKALIEEDDEADYAACVLGLREYVNKNGFKGVVFGLSGGID